jgi:hypothetical protein
MGSESDLDSMLDELVDQIRKLDDLKEVARRVTDGLKTERDQFARMVESARKFAVTGANSDIVRFNVGGKHFSTLKSTLSKRIPKPREQEDSVEEKEEEKEPKKERKETKKHEKKSSEESKKKEEPEKDEEKEDKEREEQEKGDQEEKRKEPSKEFYEPNLLEALANGLVDVKLDDSDAIFVDRNPKYFGLILDFLRCVNTDEKFELPKHEADLNGLIFNLEFYFKTFFLYFSK